MQKTPSMGGKHDLVVVEFAEMLLLARNCHFVIQLESVCTTLRKRQQLWPISAFSLLVLLPAIYLKGVITSHTDILITE